MKFRETIDIALRALGVNLLRSALTTLGIVLGVAAVVCMVAVGEGARSQISEKISKLGTNLLFIQPYPPAAGARHALTEDDSAALRSEISGIKVSAPIIWGKVQTVVGNSHWSTTVWGNDSDYIAAREWPLRVGRLFNNGEITSGAKVAIIGETVAQKLFDGRAPVGESLRVESAPFTVIGVLDRKGDTGSGTSQDDIIVIPLRAARAISHPAESKGILESAAI